MTILISRSPHHTDTPLRNNHTLLHVFPKMSYDGIKSSAPEFVEDARSADSSQQANYLGKSAEARRLLWKQDRRILPICCGIYLLCYLDRSNIGNAKVLNASKKHDLLSETHMTAFQYTIALMVFLVAYGLFEVPSNYCLKRLSPSRWIAFLMLSWSAITMGLGGVENYGTVVALRFLLGVFEAGLFPGLVFYLSENPPWHYLPSFFTDRCT